MTRKSVMMGSAIRTSAFRAPAMKVGIELKFGLSGFLSVLCACAKVAKKAREENASERKARCRYLNILFIPDYPRHLLIRPRDGLGEACRAARHALNHSAEHVVRLFRLRIYP